MNNEHPLNCSVFEVFVFYVVVFLQQWQCKCSGSFVPFVWCSWSSSSDLLYTSICLWESTSFSAEPHHKTTIASTVTNRYDFAPKGFFLYHSYKRFLFPCLSGLYIKIIIKFFFFLNMWGKCYRFFQCNILIFLISDYLDCRKKLSAIMDRIQVTIGLDCKERFHNTGVIIVLLREKRNSLW